jgi:hypothetical protein
MPLDAFPTQKSFPELCLVTEAVEQLSNSNAVQERGAIYTRRDVVEFILDLVGYRSNLPLHEVRLLEPSFGAGDFLLPAIERLLTAIRRAGLQANSLIGLGGCIRAVELHRDTFLRTFAATVDLLTREGVDPQAAKQVAGEWLHQGDFLLADIDDGFDFVVGNPPYVRQEMIPPPLLAEYRKRYSTVFDRADIYIPFIERSLALLRPKGSLGFICADRWMKNKYGGPLRELIADSYNLKFYVDLSNTQPFQTDVTAYPAITIITREPCGMTRLAFNPELSSGSLGALSEQLNSPQNTGSDSFFELSGVMSGNAPWILEPSNQLSLVRRLEMNFPMIEEVGCRIGIGVATGADDVFIAPFETLDVEVDRKLPLAMTRDISGGKVTWRGFGVLNPYYESGELVDLHNFPLLSRYLTSRKSRIAGRHCVLNAPAKWYRTIDRITPSLAQKPKLLIPDIRGGANVVFEEGRLYPHHNLYYITSNDWDIRALQAVLLSGIAHLFVATYSTKMRGGFLRFQAQYLRRIRVPHWHNVPVEFRRNLRLAAEANDLALCGDLTAKLYGLSANEQSLVNRLSAKLN